MPLVWKKIIIKIKMFGELRKTLDSVVPTQDNLQDSLDNKMASNGSAKIELTAIPPTMPIEYIGNVSIEYAEYFKSTCKTDISNLQGIIYDLMVKEDTLSEGIQSTEHWVYEKIQLMDQGISIHQDSILGHGIIVNDTLHLIKANIQVEEDARVEKNSLPTDHGTTHHLTVSFIALTQWLCIYH